MSAGVSSFHVLLLTAALISAHGILITKIARPCENFAPFQSRHIAYLAVCVENVPGVCFCGSGLSMTFNPFTATVSLENEWMNEWMNEWKWMNENLYIAHKKKTSTQNLACSQRQIHTVHTRKLSQAENYQRTLIPNKTTNKGAKCENPSAFGFSFSHWHVKGFSPKRTALKSRSAKGPENIMCAGASVHLSARRFYRLGQWRG